MKRYDEVFELLVVNRLLRKADRSKVYACQKVSYSFHPSIVNGILQAI